MSGFLVRDERAGDEPNIREVLVAAFEGRAEARLVDALRASGGLEVSLVAEAGSGPDTRIVGHVAFSRVTIGGRSELGDRSASGDGRADQAVRRATGLAPLSVLPGSQGIGIGSALARAGIERVRALGHPACVVLGDPRYYSRFGFEAARERGLTWEHGGGAAFQVLELVPGGCDGLRGIVRYAAAFDAV